MSAILFQILFILLLIIANGIFSGSEIAIVSARKVRLEQLVKKGNKKARLALKLANSPNDFLSTGQIGITLIGILSGALGGATIAQPLEKFFSTIPLLAPYSNPLSLSIVVGIITYLSLVLGELVPKRLALNNPEKIACNVASPMHLLSRLAAPVVHLLGISTEWLLKVLGVQATDEPPVTEEEIKVLIEQGTQAGMFEESEQDMVSRVFRLGDRPIRTLMTPRTSIVWLDSEVSLEENQEIILESTYSRFPVGEGSLENLLGIARVRDILSAYLSGQKLDLVANLQKPLFVPENTRALKVLEMFKETGVHIAMVIDEYGGVEGLVTLNDLVEAIVGELPSSEELEEPAIVQREDGSWLIDGMLSIDELKDFLEKESLPSEDRGHYQTMGGFMMAFLGRVPATADHFEWEEFRFEVVDMDGTRVDKVLITKNQTGVQTDDTSRAKEQRYGEEDQD
jgi:putative hemolysin